LSQFACLVCFCCLLVVKRETNPLGLERASILLKVLEGLAEAVRTLLNVKELPEQELGLELGAFLLELGELLRLFLLHPAGPDFIAGN